MLHIIFKLRFFIGRSGVEGFGLMYVLHYQR